MWPREGYFAPGDEFTRKVGRCRPRGRDRCLAWTAPDPPATSRCAPGYMGPYCGVCAAGYAKPSASHRCDAVSGTTAARVVRYIVFATVLLAVAAGIALLSSRRGGDLAAAVGFLQLIWALGSAAGTALPHWLDLLLHQGLAPLLGQVEFLRIGDSAAGDAEEPSASRRFLATLLALWCVWVVAVVLLVPLRTRRRCVASGVAFSRRACVIEAARATYAWSCFVYVPVTLRSISILACTRENSQWRLLEDGLATRCFAGSHAGAALVAIAAVLLITIAHPVVSVLSLAAQGHLAVLRSFSAKTDMRTLRTVRFATGLFPARLRTAVLALAFPAVHHMLALAAGVAAGAMRNTGAAPRGVLISLAAFVWGAAHLALRPYTRTWRNAIAAAGGVLMFMTAIGMSLTEARDVACRTNERGGSHVGVRSDWDWDWVWVWVWIWIGLDYFFFFSPVH
jgi:hypothetical protein